MSYATAFLLTPTETCGPRTFTQTCAPPIVSYRVLNRELPICVIHVQSHVQRHDNFMYKETFVGVSIWNVYMYVLCHGIFVNTDGDLRSDLTPEWSCHGPLGTCSSFRRLSAVFSDQDYGHEEGTHPGCQVCASATAQSVHGVWWRFDL